MFSHCLVNHLGQNNDRTKHNNNKNKKKFQQALTLFLAFSACFWVGLFALVSWQDVSPCALSLHTNRPAQPYSTSVLRFVFFSWIYLLRPPSVGGLVDFEVGIDIPGYLGPLSPRHLLSLASTGKRNDMGSRGRSLPASAAI